MSNLSVCDIPVEVWLDHILTYLPLSDLLRLGCTNRFFYLLTSDEPFWHRKLQQEFNFSGSDTARATGWKFIYKRFRSPQVYVWGEASDGRLGIPSLDRRTGSGVPVPTRLRIPGVHIVSIFACGMSFHALDMKGDIYVWGTLDHNDSPLSSEGFSRGGKAATHPMRLSLPVAFRTISCGRLFAAALDATSTIWTFTKWGRPFRLISPLLNKSSPETTPIQVECGWEFAAILTQSSDVLVYWPRSGAILEHADMLFGQLDTDVPESRAIPSSEHPNVIPCYPWELITVNPVHLPPIPHRLPDLTDTGLDDEERSKETRLVKIAGMDNNLIGLTNKGHVLKFNRLSGETEYVHGEWEYLPFFSEAAKVAEDQVFSRENENALAAPEKMHITHISAHFQTFVAYSAGPQAVVLMGKFDTDDSLPVPAPNLRAPLKPIVHRNLQYQSVISVVLGDYHYGALTATGKLLTWGAYSKGALGLGNPIDIPPGQPGGFQNEQHRQAVIARGGWLVATPPEVQEPVEVRFDHGERKREKYCFAATAAGWHTGALVIDLEPDDDTEEDEDPTANPMPGSFPPEGDPRPPPPRFGPRRGLPHFRIGFAGRGAAFGGGRGGAMGQVMQPDT